MTSPILQAAAKLLVGLLLMFSLYILFRGHNESGGGFIGALIASAGFALYLFAFGVQSVRTTLPCRPQTICLTGIALAISAGILALILQKPFLTGLWLPAYVKGESALAISSVLAFDIGVYLTVFGSVLTLLLTVEEDLQ